MISPILLVRRFQSFDSAGPGSNATICTFGGLVVDRSFGLPANLGKVGTSLAFLYFYPFSDQANMESGNSYLTLTSEASQHVCCSDSLLMRHLINDCPEEFLATHSFPDILYHLGKALALCRSSDTL